MQQRECFTRYMIVVSGSFLNWLRRCLVFSLGEKEYYDKQFDTLNSFAEVDAVMASGSIVEESLDEQAQHERAMQISNYANIVLLAFKVVFRSNYQSHIIEAVFLLG